MATEVIKTVKSGGDYPSLSAFEAGEQRNLVTADEIAVAECYASAAPDTSAVTIDGWTTDLTHYIKIYTPASERHDGEWDTSAYRLEVTSGDCITTGQHGLNMRVDGLQLHLIQNTDWQYNYCFKVGWNNTHDIRVTNTIFRGSNLTTARIWFGFALLTSQSSVVYLNNNIFYTNTASANVAMGVNASGSSSGTESTMHVLNCTFKTLKLGIEQGAEDIVYAKNCGFAGVTTKLTGTVSETTNSTTTPTWKSGTEFHLASSDTAWKDRGTDLSSDPGWMLGAVDIDGQTRSSTWDIGADEYVGGEATTKTVSDTGQGTDALPGIGVSLSVVDAGAGADLLGGMSAAVPVSDSGQGVESIVLNVGLLVSDAGGGSDSISILQEILKTVADYAQGTDAVTSISVSVPVSDSGQGADLLGQILASLLVADSGQGLDVVIKYTGEDRKNVIVTFTARGPRVAFRGKGPKVDFSGKGPYITFN